MNNQIKTCSHCKSEININATKCPHCQSDLRSWASNHKLVLALLGSVALFIIVISAATNGGGNSTPAPQPTTKTVEAVTSPTFDVPALVGKNINQIEQTLGKADNQFSPNDTQQQLGVTEADKTFVKNGDRLTVTYNSQTGKVMELFLTSDRLMDASGVITDSNSLLKIGNLTKGGSATYSLEFIKSIKNPEGFTGLVTKPK